LGKKLLASQDRFLSIELAKSVFSNSETALEADEVKLSMSFIN
jgi:hypothetical protein